MNTQNIPEDGTKPIYKVVYFSSLTDLAAEVDVLLKNGRGWKVSGGVAAAVTQHSILFMQALVKENVSW